MNRGVWQRERAYRRRLYYLTPVAAVLMTALFITSDRIPYREIERHVGWKGELRLLPEITIVSDPNDVTSTEQQSRLKSMTSVNLDLTDAPDLPATPKRDSNQYLESDIVDPPEFDDFDVTTVRTSRDVPYSQDYVILQMTEPVYPPEELEQGIEGSVTVELLVDETGRVARATVLSAVGPKSFQTASLKAVRAFVFQPPVRRGIAESMWIKFVIKFRIYG